MAPKRRRTPSMKVTAPSQRVLPPVTPIVVPPAGIRPVNFGASGDNTDRSSPQGASVMSAAFARAGRGNTPPPSVIDSPARQPRSPSGDAATNASVTSPEGYWGPMVSMVDGPDSPSRGPGSTGYIGGGGPQFMREEETEVSFDHRGVAEFVVNVRVSKRRRMPVAMQSALRVKELWKPRLLRITAPDPEDNNASHRATIEVFRLKSPETGSRQTAGMVQRVYLRSLDDVKRHSVQPSDALPFFVEIEARSAPSSPVTSFRTPPAGAASGGALPPPLDSFGTNPSTYTRSRGNSIISTGSGSGKVKMVREFRFGQLWLGLQFVTRENKELHDLHVEEQQLRRVASSKGCQGSKRLSRTKERPASLRRARDCSRPCRRS
jgi:hypothetical protein